MTKIILSAAVALSLMAGAGVTPATAEALSVSQMQSQRSANANAFRQVERRDVRRGVRAQRPRSNLGSYTVNLSGNLQRTRNITGRRVSSTLRY